MSQDYFSLVWLLCLSLLLDPKCSTTSPNVLLSERGRLSAFLNLLVVDLWLDRDQSTLFHDLTASCSADVLVHSCYPRHQFLLSTSHLNTSLSVFLNIKWPPMHWATFRKCCNDTRHSWLHVSVAVQWDMARRQREAEKLYFTLPYVCWVWNIRSGSSANIRMAWRRTQQPFQWSLLAVKRSVWVYVNKWRYSLVH